MRKTISGSQKLPWLWLLLALFALSLAPRPAAACPTCKDGMAANDPESAHMVKGFFYSILFMMGMPYLLLSSFGLYMYLEVRKARARKAATSLAARDPKQPLVPAAAAAIPAESAEDPLPRNAQTQLAEGIYSEAATEKTDARQMAHV